MFLKKNLFSENFVKLVKNELDIKNSDNIIDEFNKLNLSPYLYQYCKKNNLFISDRLKKIYKKNVISNIILLDFKNFLEKKLQKAQIRYLFYKGIHLIENVYSSIGDRYLGDIDLLIHPEDLYKLKKIFKNDIEKIDTLINDFFFHETYILTTYKKQRINIDIHKNFFPKNKYPIDINIFFKEDRIENHLIILIIEISSEFFVDEKRFIDLMSIIESKEVDWNLLYKKLEEFKLKRAGYIIFKLINENFNKNYPIIQIKNLESILLKNLIIFQNKRWNQFFLFFYIFDNISEYKKYFKKKVIYIKKNKKVYEEVKKFWIKYF